MPVKDPSEASVQFNLRLPWNFKRFLEAKSERDRISQNQLISDALMKVYGREFRETEK